MPASGAFGRARLSTRHDVSAPGGGAAGPGDLPDPLDTAAGGRSWGAWANGRAAWRSRRVVRGGSCRPGRFLEVSWKFRLELSGVRAGSLLRPPYGALDGCRWLRTASSGIQEQVLWLGRSQAVPDQATEACRIPG